MDPCLLNIFEGKHYQKDFFWEFEEAELIYDGIELRQRAYQVGFQVTINMYSFS